MTATTANDYSFTIMNPITRRMELTFGIYCLDMVVIDRRRICNQNDEKLVSENPDS